MQLACQLDERVVAHVVDESFLLPDFLDFKLFEEDHSSGNQKAWMLFWGDPLRK